MALDLEHRERSDPAYAGLAVDHAAKHAQPATSAKSALRGWAPWLILLAGLIIFFGWETSHLDTFAWDVDEGTYLMWTRMWRQGNELYQAVWCDQPPGLMILTRFAFGLFGESVEAGRVVGVTLAAIGLLTVALIGRELDGWPAAFAGTFFLATAPLFVRLSRAIMGSLPAVCLATLSLALVLLYRRRRQHRWLILSGLAFGLSILIKFMGPPLLIPIGLAIVMPASPLASRWRTAIRDGLIWGLGAFLPLILVLIPFDARAMLGQVVGSVLESQNTSDAGVIDSIGTTIEVLLEGHLGLLVLGIYGLGVSLRRWPAMGMIMLAWILSSALALSIYTPVWYHHVSLLVVPLAVMAGLAVSEIIRLARSRRLQARADALWVALGAAAVIAFSLLLPQTIREIRASVTLAEPDAWAALKDLDALVEPGAYIITDYPLMAFRTGLVVPPNLIDPGARRVVNGDLTTRELLASIEAYDRPAVILWRQAFHKLLPDFVAWLDEHYYPVRFYNDERRLYVNLPATPEHAMSVKLADWVTLLGFTAPEHVAPGQTLTLVLYWRAEKPMQTSYSVFNHLVDAAGQLRAQQDGLPVGGRHPTTVWKPGEVVTDLYLIDIPPDLPAGEYTLKTGMYELDSGKRLHLGNESGENTITLGTVLVTP